ncbi:MAG: DUF3617 family protein [Burkholderiaceae bacterium]|nr:DUF3617 family protein [Burkholderiaceae bacterium]
MKRHPHATICIAIGLSCLAAAAAGANRVKAGQWETTLQMFGQTMTKSTCITPADAAQINGDVRSMTAYVERVSAPSGCKVQDLRISGDQVSVTSVCGGGKPHVGTTTYHGDHYETVNTNGAKARAKWVGPCR